MVDVRRVAGVMTLGFLSSPIWAEPFSLSPIPGGIYTGLELEDTHFSPAVGNNASAALTNNNGGSANVGSDPSLFLGRVFVGVQGFETAAVELGFLNTTSANAGFNGTTRAGVSYSGHDSTGLSGIDLSVLLRPSYNSGLNGLFLRLGVNHLTQSDNYSVGTPGAVTPSAGNFSGNGVQWGVGYDAMLDAHFNVRIELLDYENIAGLSGNSITSLALGVNYHF